MVFAPFFLLTALTGIALLWRKSEVSVPRQRAFWSGFVIGRL